MSSYLLECIDCKKHYLPEEVDYVCPTCSATQKKMEPQMGLLRCTYDYEALQKKFGPKKLARRAERGLGRWAELLPLADIDSLPPLITNMTPLRPVTNLRQELKLDSLWIKDDTVQPTGSFKDRASALTVACARERNRDAIATASTGNAATALAGQAASVGMKSIIFVPESAPPAKLTQIAVYGGQLIPVKGTYDDAFDLTSEACVKFGWYNRNTAYNPFTVEGKKTAALEIWEQLKFSVPDWVVVPTGDGVILSGIEKGFSDLKACGLIERLPKLAAIQASGSQPIVKAWLSGAKKIVPELNPKTVADSISVGVPRGGRWALNALALTNGVVIAVEDEEILEAISHLGRSSGIFAEPAASTAFAGLKKLALDGTIKQDDVVVVLITGNGLKDVPAAARTISIPKAIRPELDEVERMIS